MGRGAFPFKDFLNRNVDDKNVPVVVSGKNGVPNADGTFTISFEVEVIEELFLSPLVFGGGQDQGFIGLQNIDINITWDANLGKILSINPFIAE